MTEATDIASLNYSLIGLANSWNAYKSTNDIPSVVTATASSISALDVLVLDSIAVGNISAPLGIMAGLKLAEMDEASLKATNQSYNLNDTLDRSCLSWT